MSPWGMTLITSHQVDFAPLITALQPPRPAHFSSILSSPLVGSCFMLLKMCLSSTTGNTFSIYSDEDCKLTQKIIPQIPKSSYPHSCDKIRTTWCTEILRDSSWLTESLTIITFFRIVWNKCYYLNINVLSLFQWAITEVNSNISINVKSSTADRCTYICMYLEHHALAHCLDSMESQKWRIFSTQFQTLQTMLCLKQM